MALSAGALPQADSRVSWLAHWFHAIPHIDYTFSTVNSTFDPRSNLYLESLGIIASIPGFWLILNLLAFLIFFLSRCCEREWQSKNLTCYKWTLGFLALLCCGALGVGFYGNDDAHDGVGTFVEALQNVNSIISSVKNQTLLIEQTLEEKVQPELEYLDRIFHTKIPNETAQNLLQQAVQRMRLEVVNNTSTIEHINNHIRRLNIASVPVITQHVELIRWPVTMAILSILMLFCVILLAGIISSSRSTLIAFTVLGLLAVILNWLLVSIYLSTCVSFGDLCVDPDMNLLRQAESALDKSIVNYYLECTDAFENPFAKAIRSGKLAIDKVERELEFISRDAGRYYRERDLPTVLIKLNSQLNKTEQILESLAVLLDCSQIHLQYNIAVTACCTPVLNGLAFMLLSAASAGFLFILLIWIAAHTWMYIQKHKACAESDYVQVDDHDPFLPATAVMVSTPSVASRRPREPPSGGRPRHSHTPPQTPPFPGAYNGRIPRGSEDHSPLHGRYTPPPSYEQLTAFLPSAPVKSY